MKTKTNFTTTIYYL